MTDMTALRVGYASVGRMAIAIVAIRGGVAFSSNWTETIVWASLVTAAFSIFELSGEILFWERR